MADILSVSQLNRYVKSLLDGDPLLKDLLLRGEISNFVCHQRSGHCYFTLKEGDCAVRAVMFSRYANDLLFEPENGMAVILRGAVSLYERTGGRPGRRDAGTALSCRNAAGPAGAAGGQAV